MYNKFDHEVRILQSILDKSNILLAEIDQLKNDLKTSTDLNSNLGNSLKNEPSDSDSNRNLNSTFALNKENYRLLLKFFKIDKDLWEGKESSFILRKNLITDSYKKLKKNSDNLSKPITEIYFWDNSCYKETYKKYKLEDNFIKTAPGLIEANLKKYNEDLLQIKNQFIALLATAHSNIPLWWPGAIEKFPEDIGSIEKMADPLIEGFLSEISRQHQYFLIYMPNFEGKYDNAFPRLPANGFISQLQTKIEKSLTIFFQTTIDKDFLIYSHIKSVLKTKYKFGRLGDLDTLEEFNKFRQIIIHMPDFKEIAQNPPLELANKIKQLEKLIEKVKIHNDSLFLFFYFVDEYQNKGHKGLLPDFPEQENSNFFSKPKKPNWGQEAREAAKYLITPESQWLKAQINQIMGAENSPEKNSDNKNESAPIPRFGN